MMTGMILAAAIGGPFPLLCTPYRAEGDGEDAVATQGGGAVDCAVLAKEARFVADRGAHGVIWPAANDALLRLTPDEERRGLEAIADALDGRDVYFCACCPGTNTADTVRRLAFVEDVAARHPNLPVTMLVRMADDAKGDADHERHYEAVAAAVKRPVIIQTYNKKSPAPSVELLVELSKRHPDRFGWIKEEGGGSEVCPRMRKLAAAKPHVKLVFSGWGGRDWLYQYRTCGTRGVITQRPQFTGLIVRIWDALEKGSPEADALFAKFFYLSNLNYVLSDKDMRGWNLYVLKKLGVFENTLSRTVGKDGTRKLEDVTLAPEDVAEIDARLKFAGIE